MDGRPTCADDASRLPADGTYDEEASIVSSPLVFVNVPLYTGAFSLSADRGSLTIAGSVLRAGSTEIRQRNSRGVQLTVLHSPPVTACGRCGNPDWALLTPLGVVLRLLRRRRRQ